MRPTTLLLSVAALPALSLAQNSDAPAASSPGPVADYTVRIDDVSSGLVHVELELSGLDPLAPHFPRLALPERFAFATLDEPRLVGDIEASRPDGGPATLTPINPWQWDLLVGEATRVDLSWTVPLDHRSLPEFRRDEYEAPYLAADHGMLVGGALFIAPVVPAPSQIRVSFELPDGWDLTAPWPKDEHGRHAPSQLRFLHNDLIAVGAWEVESTTIGDFRLDLAFAPGQDQLREMLTPRIPPIIAAELELFGCLPNERYLFLFVDPQPGGYGGSPKSNSMTLFVSPDLPTEFAARGAEHLIAHEYYHTWAMARCEMPDELRFVHEGFTDWYAYLVPWRLGMSTDAEFTAKLIEKMGEHEGAQARFGGSLVAAGGPVFFKGGDAYAATYAGGLVIAALCDLGLRRDPDGPNLDQLMRELIEDPRWRDGADPTFSDFLGLIEQHGGEDLRRIVRHLATHEGRPDLVAAFAEVDVTLESSVTQVALDLRTNFTGTRVDAIDPRGCGALVGLRSGDVVREVNGQPVEDEAAVRAAFREPIEGRLRLLVERPGELEKVVIDVPIPTETTYTLPRDIADRLRD